MYHTHTVCILLRLPALSPWLHELPALRNPCVDAVQSDCLLVGLTLPLTTLPCNASCNPQVWQLMVGLKALRPEGHSSDSSSTSSTSQGVTAAVPAPLLTAFLKEAKAAQRGQHGNEEGGEDEESEEEARARVAEAAQWEAVGSRVAQYLASLPPEEQRGAAAQLMGL